MQIPKRREDCNWNPLWCCYRRLQLWLYLCDWVTGVQSFLKLHICYLILNHVFLTSPFFNFGGVVQSKHNLILEYWKRTNFEHFCKEITVVLPLEDWERNQLRMILQKTTVVLPLRLRTSCTIINHKQQLKLYIFWLLRTIIFWHLWLWLYLRDWVLGVQSLINFL